MGVTKIYFQNIQLPIIRANLALLELLALIIPDECIPKLVSLTPHYLSGHYVQEWVGTQRYNKRFGNAVEKENARKALKQFTRAIKSDARGKQKRNNRYWWLYCYYQWLSTSILEYRNALPRNNKNHKKILMEIFNRCPVPKEYHQALAAALPNPQPLALAIMTAIGLIDDPKVFENYRPKIERLKKKHQLDLCLGPLGTIPLLEDYLDHSTIFPELVFKQNLFSVLETL